MQTSWQRLWDPWARFSAQIHILGAAWLPDCTTTLSKTVFYPLLIILSSNPDVPQMLAETRR